MTPLEQLLAKSRELYTAWDELGSYEFEQWEVHVAKTAKAKDKIIEVLMDSLIRCTESKEWNMKSFQEIVIGTTLIMDKALDQANKIAAEVLEK